MGRKFTLIENGEIMSDDRAIAECLNSRFVSNTDSLSLKYFKSGETDSSVDDRVDMQKPPKHNCHEKESYDLQTVRI